MPDLLSFLAGVAAAVAAFAAWRRWRRADASTPPAVPATVEATPADANARGDAAPSPAPTPTPAAPAGRTAAEESRRLALSLADELANVASGVEGRAHHLIDAIGDRDGVPRAAEALLAAVQRLRILHGKLTAFGDVQRHRGTGPTAVAPLIARLRNELQPQQLGLELCWEPPPHLPEVAIAEDVARETLTYLCGAMLRAERGATHFAITTETCFAMAEPRLRLELMLEWTCESHSGTKALFDDPTFTLDLEASNRLIVGNGGELELHHLPGRSVCAVVHWPLAQTRAATDDAVAAEPTAPPPMPTQRGVEHRYGGALVLEADPSVRTMIAKELKATGRAVFACADASSARTFLEATPDRFELLIVDHPQRLDTADVLAATIRAVAPDLKVFVTAAAAPGTHAAWPRAHHLQKPFGVHELRAALASVLAAG